MYKIVEITPATISDDEFAAVAAALAICTERQPAIAEPEKKQSNWKKAMLLEGAGRKGRISSIDQLVKLSVCALVGLFTCAPAWCQNSDSSTPRPWSSISNPETAQTSNSKEAISESNNKSLDQILAASSMPPVAPNASITAVGNATFGRSTTGSTNAGSATEDTLIAGTASGDSNTQDSADQALQAAAQVKRVRVGLVLDSTSASLSFPDGAVIRDTASGATIAELPAQSTWQITSNSANGLARICFDGKTLNSASSETRLASGGNLQQVAFFNSAVPPTFDLKPLPANSPPRFFLPAAAKTYVIVPAAQDGTFALAGKLFRGALVVQQHAKSTTNGFDFVNHIDIEDYLLSVVPSEMPSGWPLEALKAQAIAARSYTVANLGKHAADNYDLKATVDDQAYTGVTAEHTESTQAVAETRGQVLQFNGKAVSAFFHSASGGFTEVAENVWSRPVPYLRAVPDYDDESPNFAWTRNFTIDTAEQSLNKASKSVGSLLSLTPVARGVSPRVRWLMAVGTDRVLLLSGEECRRIFGLPSTAFNIGGAADSYIFAGRGYGHGLGMSQWGAKKLAESGWTAPNILTYYYKDVTVNQF